MDYPIPTLEHLGWTLIVYKVYYQGYQFLVMTFVWAGGGPDNLSALKSGSGSGLGLGLCHHTHDRRKKGLRSQSNQGIPSLVRREKLHA